MSIERTKLKDSLYQITPQKFDQFALELFQYQVKNNNLYQKFVALLEIDPKKVETIEQIPFLPISFYKTDSVQSGSWNPVLKFESSGTTGMQQSRHWVREASLYEKNCVEAFKQFYGDPKDYVFLALLPSYLERQGSSLVYMLEQFIQLSNYPESGFYLYDTEALAQKLQTCLAQKLPTILWGVTYALLDFAAEYPMQLPEEQFLIMETGGMKGRRKELLRSEVHQILSKAFGQSAIHSEYGMTELLSQAYSKGDGIFWPSNTLKILIRDSSDPLSLLPYGRMGAVNIIDLANIDSCAFIATDDLGKAYADGSFELMGRLDASDIRGCNLLLEL